MLALVIGGSLIFTPITGFTILFGLAIMITFPVIGYIVGREIGGDIGAIVGIPVGLFAFFKFLNSKFYQDIIYLVKNDRL